MTTASSLTPAAASASTNGVTGCALSAVGMIDLGHDPDVLVEHRGPVVRVWKNGGQLPSGAVPDPDEPHIDIPRHALPKLLAAVQQDLAGFSDRAASMGAGHPRRSGTPVGRRRGPAPEISAPLGI